MDEDGAAPRERRNEKELGNHTFGTKKCASPCFERAREAADRSALSLVLRARQRGRAKRAVAGGKKDSACGPARRN
jgi:hypothetical protein